MNKSARVGRHEAARLDAAGEIKRKEMGYGG